MQKIVPVILSGGFGSRLWPLSRRERPKQFLPIFNGESLFQKTCRRVSGSSFTNPLVISNQDHRFLIGEQLAELGVSPESIILEPLGRNTAAPAALAALYAEKLDSDALVLLLPSDHLIADEDTFHQAVMTGAEAAKEGLIVTFGIKPSMPETGYGYIRLTQEQKPVRTVDSFVEKPDAERAKHFVEDGNYLWNAGIFLFSAKAMCEAFKAHAPDILHHVSDAYANAKEDLDFLRLEKEAFSRVESTSIDYAIMEKQAHIACVPMDPDWSDLGSWSAIWDNMSKDDNGNLSLAETIYEDSRDCLVYSDEALVSVIGLKDVMIINTKDALLVASKERSQDVKKIVEKLDKQKRREIVQHRRVYRPWGWSEQVAGGKRFKVQSMMVKPGEELSLQRHIHRAEHWIVVSGTLKVTVDGETELLSENQSLFVPLGASHKLSNPGKIPVRMIEVQSGAYIGDDDILREG